MSEFKFFCPECGQKILGDTAYVGTQIACPTCQKIIRIPAAASDVPGPAQGPAPAAATTGAPPPPPIARTASQATASSPTAPASQNPGRFSALAKASLICSVFVPLGAIPGLICGHLAKARMNRDIFLEGEKMANVGLGISYGVLIAMLAMGGIFFLARWHFSPVKIMANSPGAIAALQARVVDDVVVGQNEDDHDVNGIMQYERRTRGKRYRTATRGGYFSYTMKVRPDQAMTLDCRYWGGERRGHVFDIAVDGQIIATQDLTDVAPGHFFDMEYKIPAGLTRGKTEVQVEFRAHPGMTAGGLYACQMLRR